MHPGNVAEWRAYANKLAGEELRRQAIAMNSTDFVRQLIDEGVEPEDVHRILAAVAQRFVDTGQRVPGDGLYDLDELLATAPA